MSEQEQQRDDEQGQNDDDGSVDEFVKDIEEDPSTAGDSDEPGDELRGG